MSTAQGFVAGPPAVILMNVVVVGALSAFAFVWVTGLGAFFAILILSGTRDSERGDRLAERARWRHSAGARGRQGRRAWRKLVRAGKRQPAGPAADLLWGSWVWDPDDKGWALFRRWRGQKVVADLNAAIAASPPRVGNWPGCAAFCARNDLVPTEPVELARFYTLTRQPGKRRALDPDGGLLAAAYRAAPARVRTALREALADEGDLAAVPAVAAGSDARSQVTGMTRTGLAYPPRQFADSRDWAGLWRLVQEAPLADAVDVVRMIDENWRPASQRERDLYALLARAADDADLWKSSSALSGDRLEIKVQGDVLACARSASGGRLAVMTNGTGREDTISVYALPDWRLVTRHSLTRHDYSGLAYLPDGTLIIVDRHSPDEASARLYRCLDSGALDLVAPGDHAAVARAAHDYDPTFVHVGPFTFWSSSGHGWTACSDNGYISVDTRELNALRGLAEKPQAEWQDADLATALAAAPAVSHLTAAMPFYQLLRACLQLRFGRETGIGRECPEIGAIDIGISQAG